MFKKVWFLVLALCLLMGAQVFFGCDANSGDDGDDDSIPLPAALKGKWISMYGEEFEISDTEFSSGFGGSVGYKGPILNVRSDGGGTGAGYITIKLTQSDWTPAGLNNYYVIHWKDLTAKSAGIAGSSEGAGKASRAEAESAYTVIGGYFNTHSFLQKISSITGNHPSDLVGSWSGTYDDNFTITNQTVTYSMSGVTIFSGDIVNVRSAGSGKGYITFKYTTNFLSEGTDVIGTALIGKYCVLYWENYSTNTSADIAVASENYKFGEEGKDTQAEAESTYTDASTYFDVGYLDTYNKD
jgi:hypothetical protein